MRDGVVGEAPLLGAHGLVDLLLGQLEVPLQLQRRPLADDVGGPRGGGGGGGGALHGAIGAGRERIGGSGGGEEGGEGIEEILDVAHASTADRVGN